MSDHLLQTIPLWWYYLVSGTLLVFFAVSLYRSAQKDQWLKSYRTALEQAREQRSAWKKRAIDACDDYYDMRDRWDEAVARVQETEAAAGDLVTALLPLLEKTDWTTGQWGGRLPELQAREAKRNEQVVALRQAVSRIPAVAEMDPIEVLAGAGDGAWKSLQTETGVPEDQQLEFSREGGVRRVSRPVQKQHIAPDNSSDFGTDYHAIPVGTADEAKGYFGTDYWDSRP